MASTHLNAFAYRRTQYHLTQLRRNAKVSNIMPPENRISMMGISRSKIDGQHAGQTERRHKSLRMRRMKLNGLGKTRNLCPNPGNPAASRQRWAGFRPPIMGMVRGGPEWCEPKTVETETSRAFLRRRCVSDLLVFCSVFVCPRRPRLYWGAIKLLESVAHLTVETLSHRAISAIQDGCYCSECCARLMFSLRILF